MDASKSKRRRINKKKKWERQDCSASLQAALLWPWSCVLQDVVITIKTLNLDLFGNVIKHVEEACLSQWPVSLYINKNKIALVQTPHTFVIQMRLPGKKTYQVIRMLWICLSQQWYRYPLELVGQKYMIYVLPTEFSASLWTFWGDISSLIGLLFSKC